MITQILTNTPTWVWILLFGLLALGLTQSVTRVVHLKRVIVMPVIMAGLSFTGTLTAFGAQGLAIWFVLTILTALLLSRRVTPAGARFDPVGRKFTVPGSWVPLALILGIFLTKYVVGVATSINPALSLEPAFALSFSALYGLFSGVFLARAMGMLKLARNDAPQFALGV